MKGCRTTGTFLTLLVLASLFVCPACGIPNFLNLNPPFIEVSGTPGTVEGTIEVSVDISPEGLSKLATYQVSNGPSLKFFYVVSTNATLEAPVSNLDLASPLFNMSEVRSYFASNFKGTSVNGLPWSPQSTMAPGFYLYVDEDSKKSFAKDRSLIGADSLSDDGSRILVGTFSQHIGTTPGTLGDDYAFGTAPYMDLVIPIPEDVDPQTTYLYPFNISKEQVGAGGPYVIVLDDQENPKTYLASYRKNGFPQGNSSAELEPFLDEDSYFHGHVYQETVSSSNNLFIHIWAAVHASEGNFTNIFWSNLEYLGYITLF